MAFYERGLKTTGVDRAQANNDLQAAAIEVARFMERFDLILSPTLAAPPVPLVRSRSGVPIGVLFSARYDDEVTLFRLAGQLEKAAPWKGRRPLLA